MNSAHTAVTSDDPPASEGRDVNETLLRVEDLHKTFVVHAVGDRVVRSLNGVSFTLYAGQHVAIAGASGAGKSSLLRCIYRNYLPDSGRVTVGTSQGQVEITALSDRAMARMRGREFGYVSQFLIAPPRRGPLAVVMRAAERRGLSGSEASEASAAALTRFGISELLWQTDCSLLSGGERQRVNIAAGTVIPPRLLLLDEPVSALDPANTERALGVIEDLASQNVSVLAVYHDMDVIKRVADEVLVMDAGRIVGHGNPTQILTSGHYALAHSERSIP